MKHVKRLHLSLATLTLLIGSLLTVPAIATEKAAEKPAEKAEAATPEAKETGFVWNFATIELIAKGDAKNGEKIAKEHKCKKCHGDTGISDEDDTPSIAGQPAAYHVKQMADYKEKIRDEKTMVKKAKKLTMVEIADVAAWYAEQKPEASQSGGKKPPALVTKGDMKRLLLPCNVCHGKNGEGYGYESPALTGQKREHFIELMTAFKDGDRENDHYQRMRFVASQLTEKEIEVLADYYTAKPSEEE